ncbi:hypothetical protein J6590_067432 [Homalodisca vitripennis]|nr:hypothetical protein J6590_067432 [Homalodisca vitripennis]
MATDHSLSFQEVRDLVEGIDSSDLLDDADFSDLFLEGNCRNHNQLSKYHSPQLQVSSRGGLSKHKTIVNENAMNKIA